MIYCNVSQSYQPPESFQWCCTISLRTMKLIIGIVFTSLAFSTHAQEELCKIEKNLKICENSAGVIAHVTVENPSALNRGILEMTFDGDTTIGSKAFSDPRVRGFLLEMPYTNQRNQSALPTLTLHPDTFVESSNMYRIFIMHANVNVIGESFSPMTQLTYLRFMHCGFTDVPTKMLESTENLTELSFENNYIRVIRSQAFAPVKLLRELHLEGNGIESLELGCFDGLDHLKVLTLDQNHFSSTPGILKGLNSLVRLNIDDAFDENGFNIDILQNLPAISNIRMGFNNMTTLKPDMFSIFPQIRHLALFGNHITRIPKGVFDRARSLFVIHLARNDIGFIEPGAFSGLNVSLLNLLNNRVDKTIETDTFSGLSVDRLQLDSNNITELKAGAFNALSAQQIILSWNKLTQIDVDDFLGLDTEELDLSHNCISSIAPNAFQNSKVKKLRLKGNPLDRVDKDKWGLPASAEISML
ncbi:leucine-rich repeat-containing protein 15-like [Diachasmimorpha longicaudata]|uniref:leucine-rich repeat-containing protein 15-like n=1 Tax=Diachasmimorpha longicaudata TaxID=58733 RepID=UPI0030B8FBA0